MALHKIFMPLTFLVLLTGCSVAVQQSEDVFLKSVLLKNGLYSWQPGTGSTANEWGITSIAVQNGGRTIVFYTDETPPTRYVFTYFAPVGDDRAFYKNIVGNNTGTRVTRYVGVRVFNSRLIWSDYTTQPSAADLERAVTDGDTLQNIADTHWTTNNVNFFFEHAVIGL